MTESRPRTGDRHLIVAFTTALFVSASLLFLVQPMFARLVLPFLGGTPTVWTTAMLFFQTALLVGYLYAHALTKLVPSRIQAAVHFALWIAALLFLPPGVPENWQFDPNQPTSLQTLWIFAAGVGVPFAFLAANAPLLQAWYAQSGGHASDDPYFLYAASNVGSFAALLSFPLIAEPVLGLSGITRLWAFGFVAFGICLAWVATLHVRNARPAAQKPDEPAAEPLTGKQVALWIGYAFVPSSLMLGVTAQISADLGSVPLIWVVPLALYLLSFVLVFRQLRRLPKWTVPVTGALAVGLIAPISMGLTGEVLRPEAILPLIIGFFLATLAVHRKLYEARPSPANLTTFYLALAFGGALGGLANSILAPALLPDVFEVSIVLVAVVAVIATGTGPRWTWLPLALVVAAPTTAAIVVLGEGGRAAVVVWVLLAISLIVAQHNRIAVLLGTAIIMIVGSVLNAPDALHRERSFFGTHKVSEQNGIRTYVNGSTIHGLQTWPPTEVEITPTGYYHPSSGLGLLLRNTQSETTRRVGVIGLGVGGLACYQQPGDVWEFYEIDPVVVDIALNPELFTFMTDCAPDSAIHIGDARVLLEQQTDTKFDLLFVDAFSSGSVPIHLLTEEALALYFDRMTPNGLVIFHVPNRYYDLKIPLARAAESRSFTAWHARFLAPADGLGAFTSDVVVMSDGARAFEITDAIGGFRPLRSDGGRLWTDDYANPIGILDY